MGEAEQLNAPTAPSPRLTEEELKTLRRVLYPKDNSRKFRRK